MYDEVMQEYLSLGHMELVESHKSNCDPCFYLPHHGVYKPESATTKLRVVFNGSCPTATGKCLNDLLYVGPVLQKDIISLILNWRMYKFVFNADISKMYRQIQVNPNHASFQRILYRFSPDEEIKDYQLKTVTFGLNCAPFLALRTLLQLAHDEEHRFPVGAKILKDNMYVDDALVGVHSIPEGINAKLQLIGILKSAGFELRKWTSNCRDIIEDLPRDHLLNEEFLDFDNKSMAKTLGIRWNACTDMFYFVTEKISNKTSFTKREVLSVIARLFDPLGWLAPVIITAKIFMQQLWLDEIQWDDPLKPISLLKWKTFLNNYVNIDKINIPRWVKYSPECHIQLHGFCDSSELAYAAVLYARVQIGNSFATNLLVSKSKVAPIKKVSLPRLELCGAQLLADLVSAFIPQLCIQSHTLHLWSDSTIVLAWLKKPSHTWTTFVANRVSKIHDKVGDKWRHVSTHDNPADLATRGVTPLELKERNLWWFGPSWLQKDEKFWPSAINIPEIRLEMKPSPETVVQKPLPSKVHIARSEELSPTPKQTKKGEEEGDADPERHLKHLHRFIKAVHAFGYMERFMKACHPATRKTYTYSGNKLSFKEVYAGRKHLIILSQKIYFPDEYEALSQGKPLDKKSPLLTLTPYLDQEGIIRANGRLGSTSSLSPSERHPFILTAASKFAKMYVQFIHDMTLHGGPQLMMATIRLECWIIRGKNLVKATVRNCIKCVLARKKLQGQLMAALPTERTTLSRPFANTGVDYAGPFELKTFSGRGCRIVKGYICLFVCFATKAIHLEAVSDLSTPAFMAALTRFVSRRGCPNKIFSDNGRNFVGAVREIREGFRKAMLETKENAVMQYGHQRLEWHFIPAAAPHMGGLWEAGVKSCKIHLKKIAGQIRYTFEEFCTVLASIEACLNSRPLTPQSEDINDLTALTPGHFLIGSSLLSPAEPEEVPSKTAMLNRWRKLKVIQQEFCRRWKSDYLKELNKRNKWNRPSPNLELNDLVVLSQEMGSPNDWRLGRVIELHPGSDGHVRVVDLKTSSGVLRRPVHKLVLLPRSQ
ncbi:uncharacterized protein LOC133331269 [Musca vetustissima]|uniref:uncharacterized protein LOC133331269 n=1 Tax=Musca vetustissima TaxID=27455 RepID=UPI002AB79EF5|nr:uncharacterized protein LOC133331269 [Musca vetustissima]